MKYFVVIGLVLGSVLLYLLSHASANSALSGNSYTALLVVNIALAAGLAVIIGWQLKKLYAQVQARVMGSRLTLRLVGMLTVMAILPGLLVYTVSVNFLTRAIESWFNVKVEAALEGGLRLGQTTLDFMLEDLKEKAEGMSTSLTLQGSSQVSALSDLREKTGVQDAVLLTAQGRILAFASSDSSSFLPELPNIDHLRRARQHAFGEIDPIPGKGLYLRVLTPVSTQELHGEPRILQLMTPVPKTLSNTAESVQSVYQDYQELSFSREALKDVFALTLTLVLLLAMLTAISFAFVLSRRLSAPLGVLAEGTRAIASGDYDKVLPVQGKDELGILVRSFNSMTRQLREAILATELQRGEIEAARGYLEAILSNLSSGVLALGNDFSIRTGNPAAKSILGTDSTEGLASFLNWIESQFEQKGDAWQQQFEFVGEQGTQTLLVRGSRLLTGMDGGYVVVFDDVSQLIQAQRDAAWGEVARRLAHEIKNPLTPIQLSAERLEHKLAGKLAEGDAQVLQRATHTIVAQVTALKSMVNEFSEYARSPVLNLAQLDLNLLIREVLGLYEPPGIKIRRNIPTSTAWVNGDATMLRQVLHNLLQNAQDALDGVMDATITINCEIQADKVTLSVCDNGSGFPEDLMARAFEPYVTTKRHGTGLGLAIVKKIVEEHQGQILIENLKEGGAAVRITLPALIAVEKEKAA